VTYRPLGAKALLAVVASATLASALVAFARPVEMRIDGARLASDVSPIATTSNHVFVPLRTLAEGVGAHTIQHANGGVDVVRGTRSLHVKVGDTTAAINGHPLMLEHPPFRVRGRVMVDLNVLADAFELHANYDRGAQRIDVRTIK
jgi:Copper amine oxidase N-terminal domain